MIQYAIVTNQLGKPVAVVLQDTTYGKVVYKGDFGSDLHRSFDATVDRPIVMSEQLGKSMLRRKVPNTKPEYLRLLLDSFVHPPYKIRSIDESSVDRVDTLADKLEQEYGL